MNVTEVMIRTVVTTTPYETIGRALHLLEDSGIRHLPVVEDGKMVGMLSDRDVREYRLPVLDEVENQQLADDLLARPVSDAMNTGFVFVDHLESMKNAVDVMIEYGVGALPVVQRETGELLGMISYVDVLRLVRKLI